MADPVDVSFHQFDLEGSGYISTKEVALPLGLLDIAVTGEQAAAAVRKAGGGDRVTLAQYKSMVKDLSGNKVGDASTELKEVFATMDRDKNGKVLAGEIMHIMCSIGDKITKAEANMLLKKRNLSEGDKIGFDQFVQLLTV